MNSKTAKRMRAAVKYHPARTPAEYEKSALHHIAHMPVFQKHARIIREMGAGGSVVSREVTKIRYGRDGRTPISPVWALVKDADGVEHHVPQTEFVPVTKPIKLKKGTAKATYRLLKRLERRVGLDNVYNQFAAEAGVAA